MKGLLSKWFTTDSLSVQTYYMICAGDAKCWSQGFCRNQTSSHASKDSKRLKTVDGFHERCLGFGG